MIQYIRLSGLYCFYTFSQQGWLKQVISICKSNIMACGKSQSGISCSGDSLIFLMDHLNPWIDSLVLFADLITGIG